jgi:nitrogen regulatory protein PII
MEIVQGKPIVNTIILTLVRSYRDQQRHETIFKKTMEELVINDKDWPGTLETINEYLASQYGGTGATFDYLVRPDIAVKPEAEDHVDGYDTVDQEMNARAPHTGRAFVDYMRKVWDITFVTSTYALFTSSRVSEPGMEGTLICSCLTISLVQKCG